MFSERLYMSYARNYGLDIRIARFHNIFGTESFLMEEKKKHQLQFAEKLLKPKIKVKLKYGGLEIKHDHSCLLMNV